MILFISNPGEDYQDVIFYAFKKTFGPDVVIYPGKPNYFESHTGNDYRNCHYDFPADGICTEHDIITSNRNGTLKAVIIISSGYRVWPDWEQLREKLYRDGKRFPVIIIDGADGDRIQYDPSDWDLYFAREYHVGSVRHELEHYPKFQTDALLQTGKPPKGVYPLPFSIIPEKFPPDYRMGYINSDGSCRINYGKDVFFRGAYGKQRAKYLEGVHIDNSLIDIHAHTPIHLQNREDFFSRIQTAKINLNITAGGNDCMRFWELLGCGGFVLTERHDQVIEPPFKDKIHLDSFSTRDEMLDKIKFYLKHEHIREAIRKQGYKFAMANHTCYNRMQYIINKAKELGWNIQ